MSSALEDTELVFYSSDGINANLVLTSGLNISFITVDPKSVPAFSI